MTIDQLCEITGLTRIQVSYALRHGKLKAPKMGKLVYDIQPGGVLDWMIPDQTLKRLIDVYGGNKAALASDLKKRLGLWSDDVSDLL